MQQWQNITYKLTEVNANFAFSLFCQNFGSHGNVRWTLQSKMSTLDWPTTKSLCY